MTVAKFGNMSMLLPSSTCCQTSFYKNLAQKWEMYQQVRVWVSKGTYNCRPFSFWPSFWFANLSDNLEITPSQRLSHIVYPIYILKGVEYFYTMNQATHNNDIRRGSRDHLLINKVRVRSSSFITVGDSFTLLVNNVPFCFWAKFWQQTITKSSKQKSENRCMHYYHLPTTFVARGM